MQPKRSKTFQIGGQSHAKLRVAVPGFSQNLLKSPNFHVLALAPYQVSTVSGALTVTGEAQIEAQKAATIDVWLGFPRVAYPLADTPCDAEK